MKNNMKNLAGFLLGEMLQIPVSTSISIHNENEEPMVVANLEGQHFFFTETNVDEWKSQYNYFETYVKAQETMNDQLRKAAYLVLSSALKTKAYTVMNFYPRQADDDGVASMQVYSSVDDDNFIHEGVYEDKPFMDASLAKILTAHKLMRKEGGNGNN